MVSRRAPRYVHWPGKLLWAPASIVGLLLTFGAWPTVQARGEDTWSVVVTVGAPMQWLDNLAMFIPGVILLVLGVAAFIAYVMRPFPWGRLVAVEFPLFTMAAWIFGVIGLLSVYRFDGHSFGFGANGFDWAFLAYLRTTVVDIVVAVVSLTACLACWILSWGLASETDADEHHQYAQAG